ncbi:MAG: peptide-methionine (S)-S-oxide reductase, partial [bacterium]|nr:peptide-methionine (S)-S-oxide reductase [bacterium]
AEVIKIEYDSSQIAYRDLLTVFFGSHDATEVNRQGNDVGTQYRSVVLYADEEQKKEAEQFIKELNDSAKEGKPIATEVASFTKFYPAEPEHLDYYARNKEQGYCQVIIAPKLQKVQEKFAELLKTQST